MVGGGAEQLAGWNERNVSLHGAPQAGWTRCTEPGSGGASVGRDIALAEIIDELYKVG
jgi:hypothetical protein